MHVDGGLTKERARDSKENIKLSQCTNSERIVIRRVAGAGSEKNNQELKMMMYKIKKRKHLFKKGMRIILFSIVIFSLGYGLNYVIHSASLVVKALAIVAVIFAFILIPKEDL